MWNIVWVSPQGHRSVSVSRHFILQAPQCHCSVRKRFSRDQTTVAARGRSKGVLKALDNEDLEAFYDNTATEVESGLCRNDLRPAFRAIKRMSVQPGNSSRSCPVLAAHRSSCTCTLLDAMLDRWREHDSNTLNHAPATDCAALDTTSAAAVLLV